MPRDAKEYSDEAFLDLIAQMLGAGMSDRQISAAFDDWFSIELLLQNGQLNLTHETLAEVSRRFGWIHSGVTAFLALGISYTEYCERRNRRKYVTIEEHRPLTSRSTTSIPLRHSRAGPPDWEDDPADPPHLRAEQPRRYDPESVPRRAPRLRDQPIPPPPPPWLQSRAQSASPSRHSE
jgi:hypothetical protein